jgi:hypothetical protein
MLESFLIGAQPMFPLEQMLTEKLKLVVKNHFSKF